MCEVVYGERDIAFAVCLQVACDAQLAYGQQYLLASRRGTIRIAGIQLKQS